MFVFIYLPTLQHDLDVTQGHFFAEFNRNEFRYFFLLDQLPYDGWRV